MTERHAAAIVELLNHLPLKEGTNAILSELYDLDFRIAALTNAPKDIIVRRMERTGLISYFESVISAADVRKYKPEKQVYLKAAARLAVPSNEILFVSSHSWDIAGAATAGFQTAFVQQVTQLFYPLAHQPTVKLKNLADIVPYLRNSFEK